MTFALKANVCVGYLETREGHFSFNIYQKIPENTFRERRIHGAADILVWYLHFFLVQSYMFSLLPSAAMLWDHLKLMFCPFLLLQSIVHVFSNLLISVYSCLKWGLFNIYYHCHFYHIKPERKSDISFKNRSKKIYAAHISNGLTDVGFGICLSGLSDFDHFDHN